LRQLELALAVLRQQRTVAPHGKRIFGEGPQLDRTAHTMRGADPRDADQRRHGLALTLRGGFGLRLTLLARHGLLRVVAGFALLDAGSVEETRHAVRRLRALGDPGLHLLNVELEARLVVLRQQRVEIAET